MQVDRDAAAVVFNGHGIVSVNRDDHSVCKAGQSLVDGVIDDFVHHMMQSAEVIGIADVHPRTLAYGLEAPEYFDVFCGVVFCHRLSS